MAKFVMACAREGFAVPEDRVRRACLQLVPDNVMLSPPEVRTRGGLVLAVVGPTFAVPFHDTSLCLGQLFGAHDRWWLPESAIPDGSFALVRADDDRVELATDAVASRSIFYALTDHLFVASTSQRAIVTILGDFRLNPQAVSWMLSAGSLGPGNSWDVRISRMDADARVLLDRATWKLTTRHRPAAFDPKPGTQREHLDRLREAALSVCDDVNLGGAEWRLPLSGGHDSRFLLLRLARRYRIPCITWGLESARNDPRSDAYIAQSVTRHVGVPHQFFPMNVSPEAADALFARFLTNGDGCVDHVSAYMDGFDVWRRLHAEGVAGIVRGDEGCGWGRVLVESAVRWGVDAIVLRDFYSREQIRKAGLADQDWPAELARAAGESIATWRDRLYHAFRIPVVLASLTDLKTAYVEVLNPLLSRRVLDVIRSLPDSLRTDKVLFKRLVESMSPPIPFATRNAIPEFRHIVRGEAFARVVRREVLAGREEGSLPATFVEELAAHLPPLSSRAGGPTSASRELAYAAVRMMVPLPVRNGIRSLRPRPPSYATLAFRAAIVSRMARDLAGGAASHRSERA